MLYGRRDDALIKEPGNTEADPDDESQERYGIDTGHASQAGMS